MRRAQAMIETVLAIVFLTALFLALMQLSRMAQARIMLDHAAARAARAKAVGFNDYMCVKSARVAMIPVSGERIWPEGGDWDEVARVPVYLESENEARGRAILEYENWRTTEIAVDSGSGAGAKARAEVLMTTDEFRMDGMAEVESHYPFYMYDQGR
jgi:hypothetical protein